MSALGSTFRRDAAWMLFGTVGAAPAVLLASVALARWLPPAENGQVQALVALLTVASMTAQLGSATSVVVRYRTSGTPPARVASAGLVIGGAGGLGTALVLLALREPVGRVLLAGAGPAVVGVLAATLPLAALAQTLGGLARAAGRFRASGSALWLQQAGRLLTVAVAAVLVEPSALGGAVVVGVPYAAAALLLAITVLPVTGLARPAAAELRATASFGSRTLAILLTSQLHERLDVLLLAALRRDPVEVAIYAVAVGIASRLHAIPLSMSAALLPRLGGSDPVADGELVAAALRRAVWVTVAPAIALGVASPLVPLLFGPDYQASVAPLLVLLPASVAWPLAALPTRWFQARDRQLPVLAVQLLGLASNAALCLMWIPDHGALGAAAASLVSYGAQAALLLGVFLRDSGIRPALVVPRWADARIRA